MRIEKKLSIAGKTFKFLLESAPAEDTAEQSQKVKPKKQWFLRIRIVGLLALLMLAIGIWIGASRNFHPPKIVDTANSPFHLSHPVIAMEFIQSPEQLSVILGRDGDNSINSQNRHAMRAEVRRDFVLIVCYALLYIAVSLLLARRRCPWAVYLAWVAVVSGISVAVFDIRENLAILNLLSVLDLNQLVDQQMVNAIHTAAILKWALGFVTSALLALTFFGLDKWLSYIGYALALTAAVGFVGLVYLPLLPLVVVPMSIGLILLLVLALFRPQKFVLESC